ncbi:MAG TPA: Rne/Rng family ribonuclease [Candidatus Xenobia bacterium]|nr:Rne/Rng family ribonuclease [Candidatus Xenobia bacterium]
MGKEILISSSPHETKVALLEDGQLVEFYIEREKEIGLAGSIYKGRVTRVLPGMQSAFIDIGLERDAFLYVSDYFEELEELADTERVDAAETVAQPSDEASPQTEEQPQAAPAGEPEATPAAEDAQPQPRPELEPEEDRQPPYVHHEPALQLPETRPHGPGGGRGRRHRRGRRRGGRGRRPDGRAPIGPMMDRRPFGQGEGRGPRPWERRDSRSSFQPRGEEPPADYEPIILPGESLAKYRDRVPAPSPSEPQAAAHPETSVLPQPEMAPAEPMVVPEPEAEAAPEPEVAEEFPINLQPDAPTHDEAIPVMEAEPAEDVAGEDETNEEGPEALEETGLEAPVETELEGESAEEEPEGAQPVELATDNGIEGGPTLAEVEQVRRYQEQSELPPSVVERTAGGVEWVRGPRDARRPRGGRGRFRRGRGGRGREMGRGRGRGSERRFGQGRPQGRPQSRPHHARPSRGQPAIAELLRPGQEIIVQIAKEQMGKKGARITSHITLPGRYLVFMPTINHIGISRKIGTAEERARLRRILLELKGNITGGFVVRTAAAGCSEEDLRVDIDYLVKLWHDIRVKAEGSSAPALLHRDLGLVERILRDHLTPDYETVWVDNEEDYARVVEWVSRYQGLLANRAKLYTKPTPMFEEMGVQQEIDRALRPKVWLKSGGYMVINQTEALVAIDVNTGKFVGKGSTRLEDTIVKTNLEAVQEVVRQIRLRDLGGIIIIDFIDMEDPRNRHRVMRALEDALRADRSPSKILPFNEFGLVAITRKRTRQSLERVLCQPCPVCVGTGMVKSVETLCLEIQSEARRMASTMDAPELTVRAHPEIVKALKGAQSLLIRELEEQTSKNIILQADNTLHFEQYNIY